RTPWESHTTSGRHARPWRAGRADTPRARPTRARSGAARAPRTRAQPAVGHAARPSGRSRSKGEELDAAADVQPDTGDVRRQVGAEERDCVRNVLRLAGAAHRGALDHSLVHVGIAEVECLGADDPGN